ncbi:hypothetical protein DL93DRAFT_2233758 [Clavulina sp. PMI_390]|nr:hypothetical protein DL93DRAFT_2233758 [Clavulina sp. PMI_390]
MRKKSEKTVVPRSRIERLPAELIDLIINLLAKEDVYTLCKVNPTFNGFANKRSWRVYKMAFSLDLDSLKVACQPIVSNPGRARNIRVLVLAPGFSLSKQPLPNRKGYSTILLPTFDESPASPSCISKLLTAALELLPNVREVVIPELRLYYPHRTLTTHQIEWLKYVCDIVKKWCQTSSLPLKGVYSSVDHRYIAPILEPASSTLERVALLDSGKEPDNSTLEVLDNPMEPLISRMLKLTHLVYPPIRLHLSSPLMPARGTGSLRHITGSLPSLNG